MDQSTSLKSFVIVGGSGFLNVSLAFTWPRPENQSSSYLAPRQNYRALAPRRMGCLHAWRLVARVQRRSRLGESCRSQRRLHQNTRPSRQNSALASRIHCAFSAKQCASSNRRRRFVQMRTAHIYSDPPRCCLRRKFFLRRVLSALCWPRLRSVTLAPPSGWFFPKFSLLSGDKTPELSHQKKIPAKTRTLTRQFTNVLRDF